MTRAKRSVSGRRVRTAALLIVLGTLLSGCVFVGPPGPGPRGWCYYHPYRC